MKVRYFVIKGKNQFPPIYMRFWNGRQFDQKAKTGLSVNIDSWNDAKQQVRAKADETQRDFINNNLIDLEKHIIQTYNIEYNSKQHIGKDWLKNKIDMFFGRASTDEQYKIYFIDWIVRFIEESPKRLYKGKPIEPNTIQQYSATLKKLQAFETSQKAKLRFEEVDLRFHRNFIDYCRTAEYLGDSYISKHIKNIKMWCKNIEIDGLPINPQYKSSEFSTIKTETLDVYLTDTEINKVFAHDFKSDLRLSNARNHFIFGLRTGLRVSDFLKMEEKHIDNKFITIKTKKTKQKVVIPIHQQVKHIIDSNNGELPAPISEQKLNDYIKEVCEAVGITQMVEGAKKTKIVLKEKTETEPEKAVHRKKTGIYRKCELVTTHTCRRSFATNLYGHLTNRTIMAITGHSTESQFLSYVKTTNQEHAEILGAFWAKEHTEQEKSNVLRMEE